MVMWLELIRVMNEKKISGIELAARMGCHEITISQYRSGKRSPNLEKIREIAKALGVEAKELI
jgi:transcriptional regulator with XRE-family HTH domain